ncbi:hypothetical protein BCR33DRAFT_57 [Rhizoclosmatium globosum]|uniref:Uncharacterized protein n=1 Tax=Rhizoclosmatium globosum TaxID=329046 RepID=A0A1Y2D2C9_9FUNG|nr:hypothetical protein BCR33DRAFT_57 [Rhizoclosmatium globosum]|eukprot:ORY53410.1 hypothetical protein BCR33DRAFT_57 [Rhizoclosmatium globosum]
MDSHQITVITLSKKKFFVIIISSIIVVIDAIDATSNLQERPIILNSHMFFARGKLKV